MPPEPAQTDAGAVMVGCALALTATARDPLALQPAAVVTATLYVVSAVGEIVMVCVVAPVDQRYEAKPVPASSTAVLPGHIVAGPLMMTAGGVVMARDVVPEVLHPAVFTETLRTTVPEADVENVMAFVPLPEVIAPPVMLHSYVAPTTGETLAALFVEFAQTAAGAVMAAAVAAVTLTVAAAVPVQPAAFVTATE